MEEYKPADLAIVQAKTDKELKPTIEINDKTNAALKNIKKVNNNKQSKIKQDKKQPKPDLINIVENESPQNLSAYQALKQHGYIKSVQEYLDEE